MNWETCVKRTIWYQRGCQKTELSWVAEPTQQLPPGLVIHTSLRSYQGMEETTLYHLWHRLAPCASCHQISKGSLDTSHVCL